MKNKYSQSTVRQSLHLEVWEGMRAVSNETCRGTSFCQKTDEAVQ